MAIPVNYVRTRPSACAFFAGRAWYAGVDSADKGGWVLFSQVSSDSSLLNKCYQKNDPTSEVFSDLLDDDGGVIPIPEVGKVYALRAVGNAMVVFGSKGVWSIRGGDGGFKATDYSVDKITDAGVVSARSVVAFEGIVMYWSAQGIYALSVDQMGLAKAQNVSEDKIKTYYNNIGILSKTLSQGKYNASEKTVIWSFCSDAAQLTSKGRFYKDTLLKFDTQLQCFYVEAMSSSTTHVASVVVSKESANEVETSDVFAGANEVFAGAISVAADITYANSYVKRTKYLTVTNGVVTFSEGDLTRSGFLDWGLTESPAYVVTGYNMGGVGPARQKTAPMVSVFAKRTEEEWGDDFEATKQSSIKMQTRWDFTDRSFTNKWSSEREVYRQNRPFFLDVPQPFEDGYPLIITKNKVLGRGKALQIKWQAGDNKDCKLVGWSINFVGNSNV